MKPILTTALVLALGAAALPAFAHHSGAMFDHSRSKVITGVVKEFNWANSVYSTLADGSKLGAEPTAGEK